VREFSELGVIGYTGGRRGGAEDVIRRPADNQVSATVAAQALAAFHGEPGLAYHEKGQIWENNQTYYKLFNDRITARHIVFVYTLLRAVDAAKQELQSKATDGRTESENRLAHFFRQRGANFLLVASMGECAESYLGRLVPDRSRLRFTKPKITVQEGVAQWRRLLMPAFALAPQALTPVLEKEGSLRRPAAVATAVGNFQALFEATKFANERIYQEFGSSVEAMR
jgi:hypothetical protein